MAVGCGFALCANRASGQTSFRRHKIPQLFCDQVGALPLPSQTSKQGIGVQRRRLVCRKIVRMLQNSHTNDGQN